MRETEKKASLSDAALGCLELHVRKIPEQHTTVYLKSNEGLFAVLHTDTKGNARKIWLPAEADGGTDYLCELNNGHKETVKIYPYLTNVYYIDNDAGE